MLATGGLTAELSRRRPTADRQPALSYNRLLRPPPAQSVRLQRFVRQVEALVGPRFSRNAMALNKR